MEQGKGYPSIAPPLSYKSERIPGSLFPFVSLPVVAVYPTRYEKSFFCLRAFGILYCDSLL